MTELTFSDWLLLVETVIFSGALIASVIQNYFTRQTVKEMEKTRKLQFMPRIKATLHFAGPASVQLKIQNVGKGPALDIDAVIKTLPGEEQRLWKQEMMVPDEFELFFLPEAGLEKLAEKFDSIVVQGSCKDLFGKQHKIDDKIDLKERLKDLPKLKMVWQEDPIRKIARRLDDIKGSLRDIRSHLRRLLEVQKAPVEE